MAHYMGQDVAQGKREGVVLKVDRESSNVAQDKGRDYASRWMG